MKGVGYVWFPCPAVALSVRASFLSQQRRTIYTFQDDALSEAAISYVAPMCFQRKSTAASPCLSFTFLQDRGHVLEREAVCHDTEKPAKRQATLNQNMQKEMPFPDLFETGPKQKFDSFMSKVKRLNLVGCLLRLDTGDSFKDCI